ncbi:MAG: Tim44 domain-containing protein [Stellaceae bacterium]
MTMRLPSWRIILALLFSASLVLAPAIAEARAGGSYGSRPSSMGSRGARTYQNNNAQPFSRSLAPQPGSGIGSATSGYGSGYGGGSFIQRHPFLSGLAGGLFGSWLFGHAGHAGFGAAGGSGFGTLFWLIILGVLVYFGVRMFRRGMFSGGWGGAMRGPMMRSAGAAAAPVQRGRDINLADADLNAFQALHAQVQDAWSAADLGRLRQLMTPEMLGWFSEELTRNTSQGVRNIVSGVTLLKGELSESWEEGDLQYATSLLRWRALDYTVRLGRSPGEPDFVAGGDPRSPVEAEEAWTFVRSRGGQWLLSAIQQV